MTSDAPLDSRHEPRLFNWPGLASGALLAAGAIAIYRRTLSVPLLFDDIGTIADNPSIRHWSTAFRPPFYSTAGGRPVLNLSLAVNYAVSGTAVWSYHVANLAIHVLAGLTLFGILRRTFDREGGAAFLPGATKDSGPEATAAYVAFGVALLWTLHPMQTESVTYLVQRAESLMGLFYLLTLYCFIRSADENAGGRRVFGFLCVFCCLLGMATKEVMVSAPVMVLLYDRTFLAGTFREAWRIRWRVYAGLGVTWLILPVLVLSTRGRNGTVGFGSGVSWWSYALTQFLAIVRYLRLSVWPHPLAFDYGIESATDLWAIWLSALVVIGLVAATTWALLRPGLRGRALGFAGVWFFAILAPTSLVPGNRQTMAEHRMYLALIPVLALMVIGIFRWVGRGALPCCLVLAAILGGITWRRNEDYRSALALWTDTVTKRPENAFAHVNLGFELEKVPRRLNDAIAQYREAVRLDPGYAQAYYDLGNALIAEGRTGEAITQYTEALRRMPDHAEMHDNLGNALAAEGRTGEAIVQYGAALRVNPGDAEAHNNLGNALAAGGRTGEAIAQYEEALRLQPDYAEAHNNLGNALERVPRRSNDAIAQYEEALGLDPGYAEAHYDLGNALEKMPGRLHEAIAQYEETLRLKPDYAEARNNLGSALKAEGRIEEAIAQYEETLRLKPDYAEAHNNLGSALRAEGRIGAAIAQYEEALRLRPDYAEAHNNLANALAKTPGRLNDAIAQYEEALRLRPDYAPIHFNLALALLRIPGRANEAAAHLEETLRLQPGNALARRILARILAPPP